MRLKSLKHFRTALTVAMLGMVLVCMVTAGVSALLNLTLPTSSQVVDRLSYPEKVRLAEVFHLRHSLGDSVWPGWGEADIPVILYNEEYAFLVGYPDPPAGWIKVPGHDSRGGPWEAVPDDTFEHQVYYRQRLPGSGVTSQSFTVLVGERWAASFQTKEWMKISMAEQFRQNLPPVIKQVFPYGFVTGLFVNSDWYICGVLHESFHAYQGLIAPGRLAEAEIAAGLAGERYPWDDGAMQDAWQVELNLLAQALQATSDEEAAGLARQFLSQRKQRREESGLDPALVDYERHREWSEGLAKYVELASWQQAATTPSYDPLPALANDADFESYATFDQRWSREVFQIRRMADDEGDGRFYYSGMAQAFLLDRLLPGWKARVMMDGVWLEDLLAEVVLGRRRPGLNPWIVIQGERERG